MKLSIIWARALGAMLLLFTVSTAQGQPIVTTVPVLAGGPAAVKLQVEEGVTSFTVPLRWTQSTASDFSHYELHCANEPNFIPTQDTHEIEVGDSKQLNYTDAWLEPESTYFYKIRVVDKAGRYADSNEVSATTLADVPPKAVILSVGKPVMERCATLLWTPNEEEDFKSYQLHRSTKKNFAPIEDTLVTTFEQSYGQPTNEFEAAMVYAAGTGYDDTAVKPANTYYYKVVVYDWSGQKTNSNEVAATTAPDRAPAPVMLSADEILAHTRVTLRWTRSEDVDFDHYELHRSQSPDFKPSAHTKVDAFTQTQNQHTDDNLINEIIYYYKIVVYDVAGQAVPRAIALEISKDELDVI